MTCQIGESRPVWTYQHQLKRQAARVNQWSPLYYFRTRMNIRYVEIFGTAYTETVV